MPVLIDNTTTLALIACCALAIGGLLMLHALFGDRARGRKRCPKCWYDMSGSPSLVCSECGHDVRTGKRLFRTHRRWRRALAASAMMISVIALLYTPKVRRDGIVKSLPTTVLLAAMSLGLELNDDAPRELFERSDIRHQGDGSLWDWQLRWFLRIALRKADRLDTGDASRYAPEEWMMSADVLNMVIVDALRSGEASRLGMRETIAQKRPLQVVIKKYEPSEQLLSRGLGISATPSLPYLQHRVTLKPNVEWVEVTDPQFFVARGGLFRYFPVADHAPPGTHEITFDITVEYAPLGIYGAFGPEEYAPYDRFTKTVTITISEWAQGEEAASETTD